MGQSLKLLPDKLNPVRIDRQSDSTKDTGKLEVVRHVFDPKSIAAVNGALAACRPLLVRGEPGVGKSQLAAAVAAKLDRPFVSFTVNSRTESNDLLWTFDAVRRLSEAQLCAAVQSDSALARTRLEEWKFVNPGPLWWGFHWFEALDHIKRQIKADSPEATITDSELVPDTGGDPKKGVVVLIDEIDKADSDVPNGLLEALGSGRFTPQGCPRIEVQSPGPLIVITSNQERILPDPFIRRCVVLHLPFPEEADLIKRGEAHFGDQHQTLLADAAKQLLDDRQNAMPPRPGLAEYLDLVRAVLTISNTQKKKEKDLITSMADYFFRKQSGGKR